MKITKKTTLAEIVTGYPELMEILMFKYGLHCFGCFAANFETIEQGAKAHGMGKKEIEKMVEMLNKKITK